MSAGGMAVFGEGRGEGEWGLGRGEGLSGRWMAILNVSRKEKQEGGV